VRLGCKGAKDAFPPQAHLSIL